jgi:hypothetical protein
MYLVEVKKPDESKGAGQRVSLNALVVALMVRAPRRGRGSAHPALPESYLHSGGARPCSPQVRARIGGQCSMRLTAW